MGTSGTAPRPIGSSGSSSFFDVGTPSVGVPQSGQKRAFSGSSASQFLHFTEGPLSLSPSDFLRYHAIDTFGREKSPILPKG